MSWDLVQQKVINGAGSTGAQASAAFDSNVTAGNLLLGIPGMNQSTQSAIPQMSSLTLAEERLGTSCGVGIWFGRAATTGPHSISGTGFLGSYSLAIAEYSFTDDGNPQLDQHADNVAAAGTGVTGTLPTTTVADELIVAAVRLSGARSASPAPAWTNFFTQRADMNTRGAWASLNVLSTGAYSTTYSWTGSQNGAVAIASFKAVATPLADRVKVRLSNAWVEKPANVEISNAWVPVT